MMKKLLSLFALLLVSGGAMFAQVIGVSTTPENKIAIMEEFSGPRCVNCPAGHVVLADIVANNPGTFYVVTYMPNNSSYTPPYTGDPDLQRSYPAAFYSTPYCGTSRFMPSAFINRREWSPGEKITSRSAWASSTSTMQTEASPLNVGVLANYNDVTMELTITVEVYYTSNVTDQNALYVSLAENGIFTQQSGATGPYEQLHVFRESFSAQWGDAIANTTMGSMNTYTFTFDNSSTNYDMSKCDVLAFVENKTNEEIVSGMGGNVTTGAVAVNPASELGVKVYPNPFTNTAAVVFNMNDAAPVSIQLTDVTGKMVADINMGDQNAGEHRYDLDATRLGLAAGMYILKIRAGEQVTAKRIAVQ
jgi:flagellar hook assembly protein FlgD